jgi:hypothetical protein
MYSFTFSRQIVSTFSANYCAFQLHYSKWWRKNGNGKEEQDGKVCQCTYSVTENISSPFNFDTVGCIFTRFHTILHFAKYRNYKTVGMQTYALTLTRYIHSIAISIPILCRVGLGYTFRPSYVCICKGHPSSELLCVHLTFFLSQNLAAALSDMQWPLAAEHDTQPGWPLHTHAM